MSSKPRACYPLRLAGPARPHAVLAAAVPADAQAGLLQQAAHTRRARRALSALRCRGILAYHRSRAEQPCPALLCWAGCEAMPCNRPSIF